MSDISSHPPRTRFFITVILAVVILIPSMWGFVGKFIELVALVRGDADGAFAITPVVNYLLASLGFFCMLCWAALNGMFCDIERPKNEMLQIEQLLDAQEHATRQPGPQQRDQHPRTPSPAP